MVLKVLIFPFLFFFRTNLVLARISRNVCAEIRWELKTKQASREPLRKPSVLCKRKSSRLMINSWNVSGGLFIYTIREGDGTKNQHLSLTLIASISLEKCLEPCVVFLMDALLLCDTNQSFLCLCVVRLFASSWSELEEVWWKHQMMTSFFLADLKKHNFLWLVDAWSC